MYGLHRGLSRAGKSRDLFVFVLSFALLMSGTVQAEAVATPRARPAILSASVLPPVRPARATPQMRALDAHYNSKDAEPIWLRRRDGLLRMKQLIAAIDSAAIHGLPTGLYDIEEFRPITVFGWRMPRDRAAALALDRRISEVFLAYASDLVRGAVEPAEINARVYVDPMRVDPRDLLRGAEEAVSIAAMFEELSPPMPRYLALQKAITALQAQHAEGGWGKPVSAKEILPGASGPAVAWLRDRLIAMGDLQPEATWAGKSSEGDKKAFDVRLMVAIKRFQLRHGIEPNGTVNQRTVAVLNVSLEERIAQAKMGLERLRWYRGQLTGRRIEVNLPAYELRLFDESERTQYQARIVIGAQARGLQTPEFSEQLSYLVLNPTWTVPKSLMRREILPVLKRDAGWVKANNMILLDEAGRPVDPLAITWRNETAQSVDRFTLVQRPGEDNALGSVKFMFPNAHNVYLHDTPKKHLFGEAQRAFSHGCVRLERPFSLASVLLSEQLEDPDGVIETLLASNREQRLALENPIPIRLLYLTSWVDEAGLLHFRDDIYGRDKALAEALNRLADRT